jgi:hypothetical protein
MATVLLMLATGCGGSKSADSAGKAGDASSAPEAAKKGGDGADKAYTIRIKAVPGVNRSVTVRTTGKGTGTTKMTPPNGKVMELKEQNSSECVYIETVLEAGPKAPQKFKRTYEKAFAIKNGRQADEPYQGMTIILTLQGNRYDARIEGGIVMPLVDVVGEANDRLEGMEEPSLAPSNAVKVGDTWTFDPKLFTSVLLAKASFDPAASKVGEATLAKVYSKDGKQHAVIDFTVDRVLKQERPNKAAKPGTYSCNGTLDAVIDGTSTERKLTARAKTLLKVIASNDAQLDTTLDATATKEVSAEK